jgi:hypothetical protein
MKRGKNWLVLLPGYFTLADLSSHRISQNTTGILETHQYGIFFNKSDDQPNQVDTQATPFGNAGAAVATDRISGDLLFYTDGNRVYDATHQLMAGWRTLTGNTAGNQNVAISPRPNNPDQFYIFANTATNLAPGDIFFSTVNMALPGNATPPEPRLGGINGLKQSCRTARWHPGITRACSSLRVGNDPYFYFLLVQNAANGDYHLYGIGESGRVLVKTIPSPGSLVAANFALHPSNRTNCSVPSKLRSKRPDAYSSILAVDTLAFVREVPNSANSDAAGQAVYDVEFSPSGRIISIFPGLGMQRKHGVLYHYDLDEHCMPAWTQSIRIRYCIAAIGVQVGPDGSIYHLYQQGNGTPYSGWQDQ